MHYLSLTLGPIYETLGLARSTKELWAGSYLFSHLMSCILDELEQHKISKDQIIIPSRGAAVDCEWDGLHYGAGVFPDRLILESQNPQADFKTLEDCAFKGLKSLAQSVEGLFQKYFRTGPGAFPYLKDYFKIYLIRSNQIQPREGEIIRTLSPLLDVAELFPKWMADEPERNAGKKAKKRFQTPRESILSEITDTDLYKNAFEGKNAGSYAFLSKAYPFANDETPIGFPSTRDLALFPFRQQIGEEAYDKMLKKVLQEEKKNDDSEDLLYSELKKSEPFGDLLAPFHRYYCVVHADGDNISNTIKACNTKEDYQLFSSKLACFARKAAGIINDFGGKPVYVGGDDLLFFAPVRSGNETIFHLVRKLDEAFRKLNLLGAPTLSFGITVTYHKYPLFESVELSRNLLKEIKKQKNEAGEVEKNAVAFQLIKHSGSAWGGFVFKQDYLKDGPEEKSPTSFYTTFLRALQVNAGDDTFFSSMLYKLRETRSLLAELHLIGDPDRLDHFFDNFFDEGIHQGNKGKEFIKLLKKLLRQCYEKYSGISDTVIREGNEDIAFNTFYALVRTLQFTMPKTIKKTSPSHAE